MARLVEQILKEQLGGLMVEVAILTSSLETAKEELKQLREKLPKEEK